MIHAIDMKIPFRRQLLSKISFAHKVDNFDFSFAIFAYRRFYLLVDLECDVNIN